MMSKSSCVKKTVGPSKLTFKIRKESPSPKFPEAYEGAKGVVDRLHNTTPYTPHIRTDPRC